MERPLSQRIPKPDEQSVRKQSDYVGRTDYQGNHDVFEMPEAQKPSRWRISLPFNKIALTIILLGAIVVLVVICVSILQHSPS